MTESKNQEAQWKSERNWHHGKLSGRSVLEQYGTEGEDCSWRVPAFLFLENSVLQKVSKGFSIAHDSEPLFTIPRSLCNSVLRLVSRIGFHYKFLRGWSLKQGQLCFLCNLSGSRESSAAFGTEDRFPREKPCCRWRNWHSVPAVHVGLRSRIGRVRTQGQKEVLWSRRYVEVSSVIVGKIIINQNYDLCVEWEHSLFPLALDILQER